MAIEFRPLLLRFSSEFNATLATAYQCMLRNAAEVSRSKSAWSMSNCLYSESLERHILILAERSNFARWYHAGTCTGIIQHDVVVVPALYVMLCWNTGFVTNLVTVLLVRKRHRLIKHYLYPTHENLFCGTQHRTRRVWQVEDARQDCVAVQSLIPSSKVNVW